MVGGLAKVYHHVHPLVELITCSGEGCSVWGTNTYNEQITQYTMKTKPLH